jgi:YHS domain-containing protein
MATDPVCLMVISEEEAKATTTYRGRMYYFCCNHCKKQFEENPKRYSRLEIDASVDFGSGCD